MERKGDQKLWVGHSTPCQVRFPAFSVTNGFIWLAFQIAVALAEKQGIKDKEGRILVKSDHIKATVDMSRDFKNYLAVLHKGDLSKRAAMMGNRVDNYNSPKKGGEQQEKY